MKRSSIGITMGDPAGIGPELCLRVLDDAQVRDRCVPVVFGDAEVLERVAVHCNLAQRTRILSLDEWKRLTAVREPLIVDCRAVDAHLVEPGKVDPRCGRAAYDYIVAAIHSALSGQTAGVATAPIHKKAIHLAGVKYPGHTEMFTDLTGAPRSCMMLVSDEITASFVTTHIAYSEVPQRLTIERIRDVIELTVDAVRRLIRRRPHLVVCGLNPHAGEDGLFGREEQEVIGPAVGEARSRGVDVDGPVSPDAAFLPERRRQADAFICMYHDQGHIPFKMSSFDTGVNVTLGLPIVRTSVDHGTAFDIAWKGEASPSSLSRAVLLAARLATEG